MQSGPADGGARQRHRGKHPCGGEDAGAAHVYLNLQQRGLLFLGRVFKGLCPPGELGGAAQLLPLGEVVDLYHGAVNGEGELPTLAANLLDKAQHLVDAGGSPVQVGHREAQLPQPLQGLVVAGKLFALHLLDVEHKQAQLPLGGDFGVLLAQGARRGVAGVFKGLLLQKLLALAQAGKALVGHVHLAPHLQKGHGLFEHLGHAADGADVLRDVLAGDAVPPGGAPDEQAVPVLQRHREPVELGLYHVLHLPHGLPHPAVELPQLLLGEGVVKAL